MDQHARALHMTQEVQAEAGAVGSALDQTWNVGEHDRAFIVDLRDAEVGLKRGERIGRYLRFGVGEDGKQCRFSGIGNADEPNVRDELELQLQALLLPGLAPFRRYAAPGASGS